MDMSRVPRGSEVASRVRAKASASAPAPTKVEKRARILRQSHIEVRGGRIWPPENTRKRRLLRIKLNMPPHPTSADRTTGASASGCLQGHTNKTPTASLRSGL